MGCMLKGVQQYPLRKGEWNHMPHVHAVTAWAPPCVQEKWQSLLISLQDQLQVSMREKHAPSQQDVWPVSSGYLEPFEDLWAYPLGTKLINQATIVNGLHLSIDDSTFHFPGCDILLYRRGRCLGGVSSGVRESLGRNSWGLRVRHDGSWRQKEDLGEASIELVSEDAM